MANDMPGISTHTSHQRRAQRIQEKKPDEVEPRAGFDDAPIVDGNAVAGRERELDPVIVGRESSTR
jgi:hypothetical protein